MSNYLKGSNSLKTAQQTDYKHVEQSHILITFYCMANFIYLNFKTMSTKYSLLFYLKKPKNYVDGPKPIYMRITVNGIAKEISTGRNCVPLKWHSKSNRAKGTKEDVKSLNTFLDTLSHKIADIHLSLLKHNKEITAETIKLKYLGKDTVSSYLLDVLLKHNQQIEALLNNGFKQNTLKGYKTSFSHIQRYIVTHYNLKDIDVRRVDHQFVINYEFFLRSELGCSEISAAKYIKHLRKIIKICMAHRWIIDDPFALYKNTAKPQPKEFLTKDELQRIEDKSLSIHRLALVRDIFIFCCYTGLSYADVKNLSPNDLCKGVDGKLWILSSRQKTNTRTNIPI
ncbi:MAG: phage integrase SAM-like domain-containing protein, partial [Sphingobacterium sp.]